MATLASATFREPALNSQFQIHRSHRGTCFINNNELISIIDTGATHSFISLDCATMLGLKLYDMNGGMVVGLPDKGLVTTTLVCLKFPLFIYGKNFVMDLVCLPLH